MRPGWQSLTYYQDVVLLAMTAAQQQQQQPGQAASSVLGCEADGTDAATIGSALLLEKHSIFDERWVAATASKESAVRSATATLW